MSSVNMVIIIGRAGSDPDTRRTSSGQTIAHLSVATHRSEFRGGSYHPRTDWHRITFNGVLAEEAEELRRGDNIYVQGRIEYGSYEREGTSIPTADIVATELLIIDRPAD